MASETIQEYTVGEFKGNFPSVPPAEGVDLEALRAMDADPMFVTLPVIPKVGATSKNGLLYDDELVSSIEAQINTKRPGGRFGHLKETERETAYPIPEGMWIGAKRIGESLWAKAYIPPGAARDHIKRLRAVGGQIATSIYGKGSFEAVAKGVRRLTQFDLESLDFAPPERAALGYGAHPGVTAEFEQQETIVDKAQIIAELKVGDIPQALREAILAESQAQTNVSELTTQVTELRQQVSDRDAVIAEYRVAAFNSAVDTKVSELTAWDVKGDAAKAKLDALRRMIKTGIETKLGTDRDLAKLNGVAETVWAELQPVAETIRDALAGPAAIVNGKVQNKARTLDDTPENRAKARAQFQF